MRAFYHYQEILQYRPLRHRRAHGRSLDQQVLRGECRTPPFDRVLQAQELESECLRRASEFGQQFAKGSGALGVCHRLDSAARRFAHTAGANSRTPQ